MWWLKPRICAISWRRSAVKCGPPSLIMNVGFGKKAIHLSQRILAAVTAVWSRVSTSTHVRASWSTITRICLYPPRLLVRMDMKSSAISNLHGFGCQELVSYRARYLVSPCKLNALKATFKPVVHLFLHAVPHKDLTNEWASSCAYVYSDHACLGAPRLWIWCIIAGLAPG